MKIQVELTLKRFLKIIKLYEVVEEEKNEKSYSSCITNAVH